MHMTQVITLNSQITTNSTPRPPGMSPTLPQPVLTVTADAVRGLEGNDALPALWNLFTKCKESLQEGRRLENISWRLWYRTMASPTHTSCQDLQNTPDIEELLNEKIYRPLTPEDDSCLPPLDLSSMHSPCSQHIHITGVDPSSQVSERQFTPIAVRRSSFRKGSTPVSVGKILCDIIPAATLPSLSSLTSVPSNTSTLSMYVTNTHAFDPRDTSSSLPAIKPCFQLPHHLISPTTQQPIMASCLPTPETETTEPTYPSQQSSSQSSQSPAVPSSSSNSIVVPVITTNDSALRQCNSNSPVIENLDQIAAIPPPPRLVVVDPTPNPTPHATPPATPALRLGDGNSDENDTKPLLQVPGQDALKEAQGRARTNQLNKRSQSLESPSLGNAAEECDVTVLHQAMMNSSSDLSVAEEDTNTAINNSRHSISSDATTSSCSHLGFYSSPSEYSNITAATTVSEFPFSDSSHEKPSSRNTSAMITPLSPINHPNGIDSQACSSHSPTRNDKIFHESIPSPSTSIISSKLAGSATSGKDGVSPSGRPNLTRRLSNNGSGGTKHRPVRDSSTSAKSRSRSRTGESSGTGLNGLVMTKVTSGKMASGTRGRVVGSSRRGSQRKVPSRRTSVNDVIREAGEGLTKAIMFNIGSNSDEGSNTGSKSTGSGSEMGKKNHGTFEGTRVDALAGNVSRKEDVDVTSVPLEEVKELKVSSLAPIMKGKQKEKEKEAAVVEDLEEKSTLVAKGKQKSVTFLDTAVPARVADTIADPLLPEATRRQIVITSDSEEYETEEDSWSSTESAEDEQTAGNQNETTPSQRTILQQKERAQEKLEQAELQKKYALQQAQQIEVQQQQLPQFPVRPHLLRTTSHNQVKNPRQFSRAQQHRLAAQQLALEQARELEIKEMFTKLPKQALKELKEQRSKSVGLLTQLLNPDQPPNRGYSSGAIRSLTPNDPQQQTQQSADPSPQSNGQPTTEAAQAAPKVPVKPPPTQFEVMEAQLRQVRAHLAPLPSAQVQQHQQQQRPHQHRQTQQLSRNYQMPQRMAAITKSSDGSNNIKTPLATAVTTQVQVGSMTVAQLPTSAGIAVSNNGGSAGKYRPKGRPPETVMEETDDSDNDTDNQLDLSKSVAQERLKALLEAKKSRRGGDQGVQLGQQEYVSVDALDVPRLHPFTLPLPVPPTTPRTTRRVMLVTEIPESLRRNLLWERQISQAKPVVPVPLLRSKSVGGNAATGAMLDNMPPAPKSKGRGLPPGWTSVPNLVKLTPKGAKPDADQEPKKVETQEEKRARFLARNRSCAFEYHHAGW